jgi:DNA polymerase V
VLLSTNAFHPELPRDHGSKTLTLDAATNDTPTLITSAQHLIERLYRPGYQYHQAGVMLTELVPDTHRQLALFEV